MCEPETVELILINSAEGLGISAAEPGYACVRISPNLWTGSSVRGEIAIPDGAVFVEWHDAPSRFAMEVSVPIGVHLQVRLPSKPSDLLLVDGEPIAQDSQTVRTECYVDLAVLPGSRYDFVVERRLPEK